MQKSTLRNVYGVVLSLFVVNSFGCSGRITISAPAPPELSLSDYSVDQYHTDVTAYQNALPSGSNPNPAIALQKRNDIVEGLMADIEVVYGEYHRHLFSDHNALAITSDALNLGLTSAASIATHAATKTIFSALGTGFQGLGLSVEKNYFAEQSFQVIGLAMQTRRDKVRATIEANLKQDTTTYSLRAARRDLVSYFNAGTLAAGLQELQEEAGTASAVGAGGATGATGASGNSGATGLTAPTGIIGTTGITGLTGATGNTGMSGLTGNTGAGSVQQTPPVSPQIRLLTPH